MLKNFDDIQKYGKDHMDTTMKAWGQVSKGVQPSRLRPRTT